MTVHRQELAIRAQEAFNTLHEVIEKAQALDDLSGREKGTLTALERVINVAHEKANRLIQDSAEISPLFGTK